jgi:hypothetical protein
MLLADSDYIPVDAIADLTTQEGILVKIAEMRLAYVYACVGLIGTSLLHLVLQFLLFRHGVAVHHLDLA